MTPLKRQYQIFIDEMVQHGDQVRAYKAAYPKVSDETARVQSYRLVQNSTIASAIREQVATIKGEAQKQAISELKEELKGKVLSRQQKRELLCQIALGEIEIPVKKPVWNPKEEKFVFVTVQEQPDFKERMKAAEIDNKMEGDNEPKKQDMTILVKYAKGSRNNPD